MAIAKMKFVRVYGPVSKIDDFISACCLTGEFHPENALSYVSASLGFTRLDGENPYTAKLQRMEELASVAGASLDDDVDVSHFKPTDLDENMVEESLEKMKGFHKLRSELTEEIEFCQKEQEQYSHFIGLTASIKELLDCDFVRVRFGFMPVECLDKLAAYENKENFVFVVCEKTDKTVWGVYVAPRNTADRIDRIFAGLYFERIRLQKESGTPEDVLKMVADEQALLNDARQKLDAEISAFWKARSDRFSELYTFLKQGSVVFDLRKYAATDRSGKSFVYTGWIPVKSVKRFETRIASVDEVSYELSDPSEDTHGTPPVKLENKRLFRPFEMYVSMYGLPSYGGVDITPFVAITYSILFGIMFADFGQGLLLTIGAFILYKKKGYGIAKIMVPCGCCSTFFGFVFGSVFGFEHLLDPIYQKVFGLPGKPIEVMDSINGVLLMAISIGIVLVAVAMLMNIVIRLRSKEYGEAFFSENGLAGLLLYAALVSCIVAFMGGITIIPTSVCIVMIVLTVPLLFCKELLIAKIQHTGEAKPESVLDFILQNFFELIEYILSYFSNTVSFLRIGAFVLVHSGMMMVFFSLAGNPESPSEVSPGGWLAIILGNVLVMALEGLLTGIQALRLEYYEMFSRFYDGDGRPFTGIGRPEGKHTVITTIKKISRRAKRRAAAEKANGSM